MDPSLSSILVMASKLKEVMFSNTKSEHLHSFISPSPYDTAWLAMIPDPLEHNTPLFKGCFEWLVNNQNEEGYWGESINGYSPTIDALPSTIACMVVLHKWGLGTRNIEKGLKFIHANMVDMLHDKHHHLPRWFSIVFPATIELAESSSLELKLCDRMKSVIAKVSDRRQQIIGMEEIVDKYHYPPLLAYIETFQSTKYQVDQETITMHLSEDGSLFQSPSATAQAYISTQNHKCLDYLMSLAQKCPNGVPSKYPMDEELIELSIVDQVQNLGLYEYFADEVDNILNNIYRNYMDQELPKDSMNFIAEKLYNDSLAFRLLRMHGYNVSPVYDVTPLQFKVTQLTRILDLQGVIQFSVEKTDQGDVYHSLSKEYIAQLFGLDPDDDILEEGEIAGEKQVLEEDVDPSEPIVEEEVEIEDLTEEELPRYSQNDSDLPTFADIFGQQTEEELGRRIEEREKETGGSSSQTRVDLDALKQAWVLSYKEALKKAVPAPQPRRSFKSKGKQSKGKILSWAYIKKTHCYAIKRERGVDYLEFASDFKSLPFYDMNRLAQIPMLYSGEDGRAGWFDRTIRDEFRTRWKLLKPQMPTRKVSTTEIDPKTKRPRVIVFYKKPKLMRKVPIPQVRRNFYKKFLFWFYDRRTAEAVIVLEDQGIWETIRVLDPMWLTNLTEEDIYVLYKHKMFYDHADREQADQFIDFVRKCFAYEIHYGANWEDVAKKMKEDKDT